MARANRNSSGFYKYKVVFEPEIDSVGAQLNLVIQVKALGVAMYDGEYMYLDKKLPNDSNEFQLMMAGGTPCKLHFNWIEFMPMTDSLPEDILFTLARRVVASNDAESKQVRKNMYDIFLDLESRL